LIQDEESGDICGIRRTVKEKYNIDVKCNVLISMIFDNEKKKIYIVWDKEKEIINEL
jgi:hypothetical protein